MRQTASIQSGEGEISKIADTYHAWRGDPPSSEGLPPRDEARRMNRRAVRDAKKKCEDIPGFCKSATLDDIRHHNYILTPGRYVGAAEVEKDDEPFDEKMTRLTAALRVQTEQSAKFDKMIWANLKDIGYGA